MPSISQPPDREAVTSVEFSLSARTHPFVAASSRGGRAVMEELVPRSDAEYAEYFTIVGTEPDAVVALMEDRQAVEVELLFRRNGGGVFEFLVGKECPVVFLCLAGAVPRHVESTDGQGRITAEIPFAADATALVGRFRSAYPDAELVIKRQQSYRTPRFSDREFPPDVADLLTDRQQEALHAAFEGGFFDWPREITGEELAESIGISPSTFHQHLRAAEGHLIEWFLQNLSSPESDEADRQMLLEQ